MCVLLSSVVNSQIVKSVASIINRALDSIYISDSPSHQQSSPKMMEMPLRWGL
jgi:hypothetical protein